MTRTSFILAATALSGCLREPELMEGALAKPVAGRLVINEIAVNGDNGDWVELYNPGPSIVLEEGQWYLTDEPDDDPLLFELPEMELRAGGHVVIWCDKDELSDDGVHAGFRIRAEGADLALVQVGDGGILQVDRSRINGTTPNESSYARVPDGTMQWAMGTATPGAANSAVLEQ